MASELANKIRRNREVRDIYVKLRKKYNVDPIMDFMETNYHIGRDHVYAIMQKTDAEGVTNPSLIYLTAMRDDFNL
jgi:hypothetical protein